MVEQGKKNTHKIVKKEGRDLTCIVEARINYTLLFMYKKCHKKKKRDLTFAMKKQENWENRLYPLYFSFPLPVFLYLVTLNFKDRVSHICIYLIYIIKNKIVIKKIKICN